ncbi:MAG: peptidoglycan-binding domain-containing protein [Candidatus Omnitrophota bacterium]
MKKNFKSAVLLLSALTFLSGCASTGSKETGILKNRMSALEERQDALEARTRAVSTDTTYVSAIERPALTAATSTSRKSAPEMTKRELQTALKNAGYYDGAIDGKIGPKTRKAITDFQAANKLKVDGIVGLETRSELSRYLK